MEENKNETKPLEEMTDHELLVELVKSQRKDTRGQKITAYATIALFAAVAIALIIIVPKVTTLINELTYSLEEMNDLVAQAQTSLGGIDDMIANVDKVVVDNTDSVNEVLENFNKVDFDHLNQAITDLGNVVEPLSKFFQSFKVF